MSIKLLLVLLAVLALVLLLTRSTGSKSGKPANRTQTQPARAGLRSSLAIGGLRVARGLLAVMTLFTAFLAFKFMLIFSASARANTAGSPQDAWVAAGLLAGIGLLLYFLFWTAARLRTRVNQMHFERSHTRRLLLRRHWSL